MASPKNWNSQHSKYSSSTYYHYVWQHRNAPAKIMVMKSQNRHNKGTYSVRAKYKGVMEGNGHIVVNGIRNKEEARRKAVKLARMYTYADDLKEDISKIDFGASLRGEKQ